MDAEEEDTATSVCLESLPPDSLRLVARFASGPSLLSAAVLCVVTQSFRAAVLEATKALVLQEGSGVTGDTSSDQRFLKVNDARLDTVLRRFAGLESLRLQHAVNVTDAGFRAAFANPCRLISLDLKGCTFLGHCRFNTRTPPPSRACALPPSDARLQSE